MSMCHTIILHHLYVAPSKCYIFWDSHSAFFLNKGPEPDRFVWKLLAMLTSCWAYPKYFRLWQTICVCTYANWYLQSIREV